MLFRLIFELESVILNIVRHGGDLHLFYIVIKNEILKEVTMKHRLLRRVMALALTLLLAVGLMPTEFAGGGVKVSAADGEHSFDFTTLTAAADKEAISDGHLRLRQVVQAEVIPLLLDL